MSNTLTITDNRTGTQYELPIENETIKALDLRKIKVNEVIKASSNIAAFRSKTWPPTAVISKLLICS